MTAVFDKIGVLNTVPTNLTFVILIENILETLIVTPYLMVKEKHTWVKEVKGSFVILFINSLVLMVIAYLVFAAYTSGAIALVLGIKRLQIFFVLILGYLFLKDKPAKHTWLATAVMILGTILIKVG